MPTKKAPKKPTAPKAPKKPGRKSKYIDEHANIARRLCELGATDVEIAKALGINRATLYVWRSEHAEFSEAMQVGKEAADGRVFLANYRLACGWDEEEEIVQYDTKRGTFVRTTVTKHIHPDRGANIFWMKNRLGWVDRQEHTGPGSGPIAHSHELSDAQLEAIAASALRGKKKAG